MNGARPKKILLVVDGEHSPSVVESAIEALENANSKVVALVWAGGTEKADPSRYPLDIPVVSTDSVAESLVSAIAEYFPEEIVDLSDDPIITQARREQLVAVAASKKVTYVGPGYRFEAPTRLRLSTLPTVAVIGTGKRTGKTAVCAQLARLLTENGAPPLIVTMGRGGPKKPVYIPPKTIPADPIALIQMANEGLHAASDYIEDALFTGLPTIGAWRCGGGILGEAGPNAVEDAVRLAQEKAAESKSQLLLLEGSGASIPPVHADATVTVVPWEAFEKASGELPHPFKGFGLYRLLIADALVVTGCPTGLDPERERVRISKIYEWKTDIEVVLTVFDLTPVEPIKGRTIALATTASKKVAGVVAKQLEAEHGARVAGVSVNLSRPDRLSEDLSRLLPQVDVLVTELKARAVDVAARQAVASGVEVIFAENRPRSLVEGDQLASLSRRLLDLARKRFEAREE
ncbi:MAG: hypothetical protein C4319_02415 [Acidimicrobiia bacterium]